MAMAISKWLKVLKRQVTSSISLQKFYQGSPEWNSRGNLQNVISRRTQLSTARGCVQQKVPDTYVAKTGQKLLSSLLGIIRQEGFVYQSSNDSLLKLVVQSPPLVNNSLFWQMMATFH